VSCGRRAVTSAENGLCRRIQALGSARADKFHREITNWETTSCASDGGNIHEPAGRDAAAAAAASGNVPGRTTIPNTPAAELHAALDARRAVHPRPTSTWA
jgi:hypothetical protein